MGTKLGMVLRKIVAESLQHVKDHARRADLKLAKLAEIAHGPNLRFYGNRILLVYELLQLLLKTAQHVVRELLHVRCSHGHEPREGGDDVQRGPRHAEKLHSQQPSVALRVEIMKEFDDEVVHLLRRLRLHQAKAVQLKVRSRLCSRFFPVGLVGRRILDLPLVFFLLLSRLTFSGIQKHGRDYLLQVGQLLVEFLLFSILPELQGVLLLDFLLDSSCDSCGCRILLLGLRQWLVQVFREDAQVRL
mmetsp:Transcript_54471/g.145332  ORF Transcript_54471/g.145332 Transcript_54471/m.145332 type:complete len:246 (+) Transcript_54471:1676-2413(+)